MLSSSIIISYITGVCLISLGVVFVQKIRQFQIYTLTLSHALGKIHSRSNVIAIDIRPEESYKYFSETGAIHIPLESLEKNDALLNFFKEYELIIIAQENDRSLKAVEIIKKIGIKNVSRIKGGIPFWIISGCPQLQSS